MMMINNLTINKLSQFKQGLLTEINRIKRQKMSYAADNNNVTISDALIEPDKYLNVIKNQPASLRWQIKDMLDFHDFEFIQKAYHVILKRVPDPVGLNHYLMKLRSGALNKIEILGRLRYSPEGQIKAAHVSGLRLRYFNKLLERIPIIGYSYLLIKNIFNLPSIVKNIQSIEAYTLAELQQSKQSLSFLKNISIQTKHTILSNESSQNDVEFRFKHQLAIQLARLKIINKKLNDVCMEQLPKINNDLTKINSIVNELKVKKI
jgi:Domain of unknown function (DUF4214)